MADHVHRQRPDVHFLVIGDGVLRPVLEADARRRGLEDVIHFAGLIAPEEIPAALIAMDVVVHASVREGIARVLPQALAVGRAVVAFDMDGAPEVIEHGKSGYLVPPLDVEAMADHVRRLVDDPDLRQRLALNGRAFVEREFPVERMVERINQLYVTRLREHGLPVPNTG
jgi:glycosyltransferase involved in cell wall biosynthesis